MSHGFNLMLQASLHISINLEIWQNWSVVNFGTVMSIVARILKPIRRRGRSNGTSGEQHSPPRRYHSARFHLATSWHIYRSICKSVMASLISSPGLSSETNAVHTAPFGPFHVSRLMDAPPFGSNAWHVHVCLYSSQDSRSWYGGQLPIMFLFFSFWKKEAPWVDDPSCVFSPFWPCHRGLYI